MDAARMVDTVASLNNMVTETGRFLFKGAFSKKCFLCLERCSGFKEVIECFAPFAEELASKQFIQEISLLSCNTRGGRMPHFVYCN